jgi:circadian clock protein KaiB
MRPKKPSRSTEAAERALRKAQKQKYFLCLYVTGMTSKSTRAVENIKKVCDQYLAGRYELKVVDIYQQPMLAKREHIVAVPTLIKKLPIPLRRLIGDLADTEQVLLGLDLTTRD